MARKLSTQGINLFQLIYILIREYEEKSGQSPLNLSLGNPDGIPAQPILDLKAKYAGNPGYEFHTYAESQNINSFCEGMIRLHAGIELKDEPHLQAVPTQGIKTTTALLPLACAGYERRTEFTVLSNLPAYDVIGTWTNQYLGMKRLVWPLSSENNMRLDIRAFENLLKSQKIDLVFIIRPGNPAAVGCNEEEWDSICKLCETYRVRLVNDAAYVGLAQEGSHIPLAQVAKRFQNLDWMELYSVSKSYNDPGARLGAALGSKDFIQDLILIKGNTDSGPNPGIMAAYGEFFKNHTQASQVLHELRDLYQARLNYLIPTLKKAGLKPACETQAGFFTLWKVPRFAFGEPIETAEQFNRKVISKTGIVGVHFDQGNFIRYAVCADVLNPGFQDRFESALNLLQPEY